MMKLNNRGSSLLELIVSIALMSIILVFMTKLVVDVNNMDTNNTYAKDNQLNRAEIIRMIENDITNKDIKSISDSNSSSDTLIIRFTFSDNKQATISASSQTFTYTSSDGTTRKWTIEDATIDTSKAWVYYGEDASKSDSSNEYYSFTIDIEIHTTNEKNNATNNNTLDDIIISYVGHSSDYTASTLSSCLGIDNINNNC